MFRFIDEIINISFQTSDKVFDIANVLCVSIFKGGYLFWKARVGTSAAKSTESEKYLNIVPKSFLSP